MGNKNAETLKSFVAFCEANPSLRFWQALRAWCGASFVCVADDRNLMSEEFEGVRDTFYWEGVNE